MSSPRHSPPPSAAAPKPKGILKNASDRSASFSASAQGAPPVPSSGDPAADEANNHLQWDETNLTLHELQRAQEEARMKIDEPKTPFVRSASLGAFDSEDMNFDLDSAGPSTPSSGRRGSAADQLAANTSANAGRRPSGSAGGDASSGGTGLAVGLDAADLAQSSSTSQNHAGSEGELRGPGSRSTSRSPSFSLPKTSSRRSSARSATSGGDAAVVDQRSGVRRENEQRSEMQVDDDDEDDGMVEEEDPDPETQAKHAAFAAKRNQHYGNEAEAMKIAAALAARDDDDDEDEDEDDEESGGVPPVPSLPNGGSGH